MILITRKQNEGIVINKDVIVSVLEIRDEEVRLGVEHPSFVSVQRGEALDGVGRQEEQSRQPR